MHSCSYRSSIVHLTGIPNKPILISNRCLSNGDSQENLPALNLNGKRVRQVRMYVKLKLFFGIIIWNNRRSIISNQNKHRKTVHYHSSLPKDEFSNELQAERRELRKNACSVSFFAFWRCHFQPEKNPCRLGL